MKIDGKRITADEGKTLRRKKDGFYVGRDVVLGYTYYIGGEKLDEPHLEVSEDYEEVDELISDDDELFVDVVNEDEAPTEHESSEERNKEEMNPKRRRPTIRDYDELMSRVAIIEKNISSLESIINQ